MIVEYPPAKIPRTALEPPPNPILVTLKSPKSDVFPVVEIVTYSMVLITDPETGSVSYPPAITPRVGDAQLPRSLSTVAVSPKSTAFPNAAIVTYSIVFTLLVGDP